MSFSSEMVTYPFQSPLKIFFGQQHQNLTRIRDFLFSRFRFQFLDRYPIILSNHIYEQIIIFGSFCIGLDNCLRCLSSIFDRISKRFETFIHIFLPKFFVKKRFSTEQNIECSFKFSHIVLDIFCNNF